jgi:FixJ family two-component response regulator
MSDIAPSGRVLVVDDDLSFAKFACTVCEGLGYRTAVAWTGRDAVQRMTGAAWTGVLLDVRLPDMTGLDVLRWVQPHALISPVVVVTGAGSIPLAVEAMSLGAASFLEKPMSLADLSATARTVFSVRSPQSAVRSPQVDSPFAQLPSHNVVHRLVDAMVAVVACGHDVSTVRAWCGLIRMSESSMYALCDAVGVSAKAALDLARLLRAGRVARGFLIDEFVASDARTLTRLITRLGGTDVLAAGRSWSDLLGGQRLVTDIRILAALRARLDDANA